MAAFYKKRRLSGSKAYSAWVPFWVIDEYDVNAQRTMTLIEENVFEVGDPVEARVDKIIERLNLLAVGLPQINPNARGNTQETDHGKL